MSKSLKDIVEEGFAKLAQLSDKRKDLLARCGELASGTSGHQCGQGLQKLESTGASYSQEIDTYAQRSEEVLQQTLSQIVEDNERFLASVKENLQLRISKLHKELTYTREWLLGNSSEKFVSALRPLEREMEAGTTDLRFEALKLLGELEALCERSQSSLHQVQAEISGKISSKEHELTSSLAGDFSALVQESERRRHQVTESMEKLYSEQASQMTSLTEEMDERISSVVTQHLDSVKTLGKQTDDSLDQTSKRVLSAAAAEMVSLSQESFSELEASYEYSHHELTDNLNGLRSQTSDSLEQIKTFLDECENSTKLAGDNLTEKLKSKPALVASDNSPGRNAINELLRQFSREMDTSASDLKRQLNELLKRQQERLYNLSLTAESSISTTAAALNAELKQMAKVHERSWTEREQELVTRLEKMENEVEETCAQVGSSGAADSDAADSVDGSI